MKRPSTYPPRREAEARVDDARQLLFDDAKEHQRMLQLSDAELAEVLDDLVEWFGGRPARPQHLKARRCRR